MCRLSSHTAALALLWAAVVSPWGMTLTLPRPDVTALAYITLLFLTTASLPCFNLGGDGDFSMCTTLPKTFDGRADASFLAKVLGSCEEKYVCMVMGRPSLLPAPSAAGDRDRLSTSRV